MATPHRQRKTPSDAQRYFAAETLEARRQYATIVGGLIVAASPSMADIDGTLEAVAALGALITNEPTRAELDDQDFTMLFGPAA